MQHLHKISTKNSTVLHLPGQKQFSQGKVTPLWEHYLVLFSRCNTETSWPQIEMTIQHCAPAGLGNFILPYPSRPVPPPPPPPVTRQLNVQHLHKISTKNSTALHLPGQKHFSRGKVTPLWEHYLVLFRRCNTETSWPQIEMTIQHCAPAGLGNFILPYPSRPVPPPLPPPPPPAPPPPPPSHFTTSWCF